MAKDSTKVSAPKGAVTPKKPSYPDWATTLDVRVGLIDGRFYDHANHTPAGYRYILHDGSAVIAGPDSFPLMRAQIKAVGAADTLGDACRMTAVFCKINHEERSKPNSAFHKKVNRQTRRSWMASIYDDIPTFWKWRSRSPAISGFSHYSLRSINEQIELHGGGGKFSVKPEIIADRLEAFERKMKSLNVEDILLLGSSFNMDGTGDVSRRYWSSAKSLSVDTTYVRMVRWPKHEWRLVAIGRAKVNQYSANGNGQFQLNDATSLVIARRVSRLIGINVSSTLTIQLVTALCQAHRGGEGANDALSPRDRAIDEIMMDGIEGLLIQVMNENPRFSLMISELATRNYQGVPF